MKPQLISILICFFSLEISAQEKKNKVFSDRDLIEIIQIDSTRMMYYYWIEACSEDRKDSLVILSRKMPASRSNTIGYIVPCNMYVLNLSYVYGFSDLPGIVNDSLTLSLFRLYECNFFFVERNVDGENKLIHCLDFPNTNRYYTSDDLIGIYVREKKR